MRRAARYLMGLAVGLGWPLLSLALLWWAPGWGWQTVAGAVLGLLYIVSYAEGRLDNL